MNHAAHIAPEQNLHQRPLQMVNVISQIYSGDLPLPVNQSLRYLKFIPEAVQHRLQRSETEIRMSRLQAEVIALRRELATIKQEKAELEKRNAAALKQQVRDIKIQIDHTKRVQQVAEIVQTDYFKQLQAEVDRLRYPDENW
jgi:hypothetical protein